MDIATQGHLLSFTLTSFFYNSYHLLRLGCWLSRAVAKKVVKESVSAITSDPSIVVGILGVGLFTWGAVNICKESSCYK